ncbi:translation initiation factor [Terrimonas rubra]|uniref:Translation initiation factor n=1 Tax=Terrimonas rubra TaxID=1035890 RepID=A0ABW6A232_9BACT
MSKKNKQDQNGFVFSTDPDFKFDYQEEARETLEPAQQVLRVKLETKHRAGKAVSLITGFIGKDGDLQDLAKKLKNFCGTGGSAKDGEIIIQGDQREKILNWLLKNGYTKTKRIG